MVKSRGLSVPIYIYLGAARHCVLSSENLSIMSRAPLKLDTATTTFLISGQANLNIRSIDKINFDGVSLSPYSQNGKFQTHTTSRYEDLDYCYLKNLLTQFSYSVATYSSFLTL